MLDPYLLSVLAFVVILAVLIWRDRKNIEWSYYVLFMRRTERFRVGIGRIAGLSPRFWKLLSTIAVITCFGAMAYGLWFFIDLGAAIASGAVHTPALGLLLPSPVPFFTVGLGYVLVPFWFWLIAIVTILVPHEMLHGIIARAEKLRLKSVGLLLLAIFPGAFVEPDEAQLKRAPLITRLRVYSAGSFANFLTAGVILALTAFVIWPALVTPGITVVDVNATSPAGLAGMTAGTVLYSVNGTQITSTYDEYMKGHNFLLDEIGAPSPGAVLNFSSSNQSYVIKLEDVGNVSYSGIFYIPNTNVDVIFFLTVLIPLLTILWNLSYLVGLFNILPLPALDGGLMLDAVSQKMSKKYGKQFARTIGFMVLALIIYLFIGPFIRL
jgi:membrane-associated protease RseP (regulator of RpoE activity)